MFGKIGNIINQSLLLILSDGILESVQVNLLESFHALRFSSEQTSLCAIVWTSWNPLINNPESKFLLTSKDTSTNQWFTVIVIVMVNNESYYLNLPVCDLELNSEKSSSTDSWNVESEAMLYLLSWIIDGCDLPVVGCLIPLSSKPKTAPTQTKTNTARSETVWWDIECNFF